MMENPRSTPGCRGTPPPPPPGCGGWCRSCRNVTSHAAVTLSSHLVTDWHCSSGHVRCDKWPSSIHHPHSDTPTINIFSLVGNTETQWTSISQSPSQFRRVFKMTFFLKTLKPSKVQSLITKQDWAASALCISTLNKLIIKSECSH